ncbi:hypothetical protein BEWA_049390 [Theileria equi strain WA]|uniref:Uncharacterized protein n=1 Tax=Theileria equi strain WA TaxID=1537102 RepID=L1LAG8_THEEQ|nr:hypothetical protein BEWA_049390 [Theileria equi strain WA]EKX72472.1 hypothetical protein BEWA_049390 [Theileria equi strain WA]|eukprot:XP_004831924.1 hypothetical protein BEWA_049390 [Theileria equi strain WA]
MHTYQLDLYPYLEVKEGIKRVDNKDGVPKGYKSFRYTSSDGDVFDLSVVLYSGKALRGIISSMINVDEIITYFKGGHENLLIVKIVAGLGDYLYFNPDTNENLENVRFSEFLYEGDDEFGMNHLKKILDNIDENSGFDIIKLSKVDKDFTKDIYHSSNFIFDLTQTNDKYVPELSDRELTVTKKNNIDKYPKIQHQYKNPFNVKGIKLSNSEYMKVKGGLPDDLIDEFMVYYSSESKRDPLLVTLRIYSHKELCAPSYYFLSKTNDHGGKWDIREICSVIGEKNGELEKVLENIATNGKLDIGKIKDPNDLKSKLGDISNGLTIDLTKAEGPPGKTSHYVSDGVSIPYKKKQEREKQYTVVLHADIYSFSIKMIRIDEKTELREDKLPPCGTLFRKLKVYYPDQTYKDIVFIELECSNDIAVDDAPVCVYYYSKDGKGEWKAYRLDTNVLLSNAKYGDLEKDLVVYNIRENHGHIDLSKFQNIEKLGGEFNPCIKNGGIERRNKPKNSATKGNKDDEYAEDISENSTRSQVIGYVLASLASVMTIGIGAYLIWPSMRRHIYSSFI